MSWRAAKSITSLRKYLNARFPNRSKASDGIVGDPRHKRSKSDHNPNRLGVVRAFDVTHDPKNGMDCNKLAAALIQSRDPRIKYLIWQRRILSSKVSPWKWRRYKGSNPHNKHLHISVNEHNYDDTTAWNLNFDSSVVVHPDPELIEFGDSSYAVTKLQTNLSKLGILPASEIDGEFGNKTRAAVKKFQRSQGLDDDGIVGKNTRAKLQTALNDIPTIPIAPTIIEIEEDTSLEADVPAETSNTPTTSTAIEQQTKPTSTDASIPFGEYLEKGQQGVEKLSDFANKAQPIIANAGKVSKSSQVISGMSALPAWGSFLWSVLTQNWELVAITGLIVLGWYLWTHQSKQRAHEEGMAVLKGTGDGA